MVLRGMAAVLGFGDHLDEPFPRAVGQERDDTLLVGSPSLVGNRVPRSEDLESGVACRIIGREEKMCADSFILHLILDGVRFRS